MNSRTVYFGLAAMVIAAVAALQLQSFADAPQSTARSPAGPKAPSSPARAGDAPAQGTLPNTASTGATASTTTASADRPVTAPGGAAPAFDRSSPPVVTTLQAVAMLDQVGPQPGRTSMGAVPAAGSNQYGAPDRQSARRLTQGGDASKADRVKSGDAIRIQYKMFELASGQEVEASPPEGLLVRVGFGVSNDQEPSGAARVPRQVSEALSTASVGDVYEVILPIGSSDLPPQLDPSMAYKLHVTVAGRY